MRVKKIASLAGGVLMVLAAAGTVACAGGVPTPNDQWAAAQADVGRAQAGGATAVPEARLHLQLAQEDLAKSKQLFDRDNGRATSLVAVARVEAQLAASLAQEADAERQQREAQATLDKAAGK